MARTRHRAQPQKIFIDVEAVMRNNFEKEGQVEGGSSDLYKSQQTMKENSVR